MKENSISYKTAKQETERLICEIEEITITHRTYTAECLKRVLKENEELHKEIDRMKSLDIYKLVEDWETGQLISIQKIKDKIEELNSRIEKYREYVERGIETDFEWVDNVANRETVKVLQELIEEREE